MHARTVKTAHTKNVLVIVVVDWYWLLVVVVVGVGVGGDWEAVVVEVVVAVVAMPVSAAGGAVALVAGESAAGEAAPVGTSSSHAMAVTFM